LQPIAGLHHITAITKDPQANVDFYRQALGQRLVKTTINFDDPSTYHFYYGDLAGSPGTILTFFSWAHATRGQLGNGETAAVAYTIRPESIGFWQTRLAQLGVESNLTEPRFGADVLCFQDPDGMQLELVAGEPVGAFRHWEEGPIPAAHALRGFHGVTLWLRFEQLTANLLMSQLGYTLAQIEGNRSRYQVADGENGQFVDIMYRPDGQPGSSGAGSIHHIAFRAADDDEQLAYLAQLQSAGQRVTSVQDRLYFHSIYFRSAGGVLFEIATDGPGFTFDEPLAQLGNSLMLPPWLENQRADIEGALPPIERRPLQATESDDE